MKCDVHCPTASFFQTSAEKSIFILKNNKDNNRLICGDLGRLLVPGNKESHVVLFINKFGIERCILCHFCVGIFLHQKTTTEMEENQNVVCPTLPCPASFRANQNLTIQNSIVMTIQNEPENLAALQQLVQNLDVSDKASLFGNLLLFYMQRRAEDADDQRLLTILRLCPVAVFCRDDQNMSCMHYFVMRQTPYIDGAQLLYALLDLAPQLPGVQNNFGESPLHQVKLPSPIVFSSRLFP